MARVTYGVLALAFATLVSGFFFRTSSLPLLISIGLSALVAVLILAGWSRRLRAAGQLGLDADDAISEDDLADEILVVDLDETGEITELVPPSKRAKASAAKTAVLDRPSARKPTRKPTKKSPRKSAAKPRGGRPPRDEDLDFMPAPSDDEDETVVVPPPPRSTAKRKTKAGKPKDAAARKAKPKPKPKAKAKPKAKERRVVVIAGRDRYHVPGCRFAQGPGARQIGESAAKRRRLVACSVCLK